MENNEFKWLDDILNKLAANEEITEKEADKILNHAKLPRAISVDIQEEPIKYIELINNDELMDRLPDNPLDAGGKEHLERSIRTANTLHSDRALNERDRKHLVKDLNGQLEFIFKGVDDPKFRSLLEALTREPSFIESEYLPQRTIDTVFGKSYKQSLYYLLQTKATDTFIAEIREYINTDELDDIKPTDTEIKEIREFFPNIEKFRFSNTKVENHLAKPETKLIEILRLEEDKRGFNADLASEADINEGYSYPVSAKFSLLDNAILPENFNYSSSVRGIVSAVGTAYEYDGLETVGAGIKRIRADHLLSLIDGASVSKRATPERVQELVDQIESLSYVSVEIDTKKHQEYNALKPKGAEGKDLQYKKRVRRGPLLSVVVDEYENLSKDKQFYIEISRLPILYEYAKDAGQMITFDRSLLDLTTYPEHRKPPFPIKRMTPQRQALNQMMILESKGRGSSKRYSKYIDITYKRMYQYIEDDLGGYRKESLDKNIEMVADTLIAKGEFSKKEIIPKGRKKYGTLRLYR